jgi:hypothetical protein
MSVETDAPLYPNIRVQLVGENGNAFVILGRVCRALKQNDVPKERIEMFRKEAVSGDYDHLLQTVLKWVEVE